VIVADRPPAGEAAGALVLLHGRGADEHDLYPLLDVLDPERRLHGYSPRGPLSLPPGGAHWYVVPRVGYPDPETFRIGYEALVEWFDSLPYPAERIVVGGFSQGAVMTYALSLGRGRPRPRALIAMSGFIPSVGDWDPAGGRWEADLTPPFPAIAIAHGTYDPVIPVEFGRRARATLETAGAEVLYRESPLAHQIDPSFIDEARALVARAVPA
jgi:phospholipase/carboxylesterase